MMKKILLCLLLILTTSCTSEKKSIICSTVTQDESVEIDLTYTYGSKGEVVQIQKDVIVYFSQDELEDKSLNDYYKELEEEFSYDLEGVSYHLEMDQNNNSIISSTIIDLSSYNFKSDCLEIGNKEDYENITEVIKEITSLGYYRCNE